MGSGLSGSAYDDFLPTKESGIPRIEQLVVTIRLQLDYPRTETYVKALEALDELATLARERPE